MKSHEQLESHFGRIGALQEATGVLHWDMSVMMPPGGAEARAEQLAAMKRVVHELMTGAELADWLDEAEATPPDDPWACANVREMRRLWRHAVALDGALVEALSRAASRCEMIWREARPKGDFAMVAPSLAELMALVREEAAAKADAFGVTPYEALLDQYEPGCDIATIDALFDDLAEFLPGFLARVLDRAAGAPAPVAPEGPFPVAAQRALAERLMGHIGFDFEHGRLDVSLHPFCGGVPDDVRITTRYEEGDFSQSLMGVLHETGHAMYERGLPPLWRRQPVGEARGMAMHESQSLLIEMQVCRGREFLRFAAPLMREAFAGTGPAWETDNLYRLYTRVAPDFIRVDADEVTYPAHVILRTRLERALIDGAMEIVDLPAAWNQAMDKLLGVTPPSDREGCLQDIHWFSGSVGYFPTYTMGALAAAQLYAAARRAEPDIPAAISRGDFAPLMGWLGSHVHAKGSLDSADDILTAATGAPLGTAAFKAHLEARYLA
ncbi:MAG: carboxypeptidase M32 [Alphaproteobacteria bacterium]